MHSERTSAFVALASSYDRWYETPLGRLVDRLEKAGTEVLTPATTGLSASSAAAERACPVASLRPLSSHLLPSAAHRQPQLLLGDSFAAGVLDARAGRGGATMGFMPEPEKLSRLRAISRPFERRLYYVAARAREAGVLDALERLRQAGEIRPQEG